MEPEETIESLAAKEAEQAEEVVSTAPAEDPEALRAFGRGIAAEEGWISPAQLAQIVSQNQPAPAVDTTPKWPGTNQPLPSNYESLDDDTKIAFQEMALNTERQLQALSSSQETAAQERISPIMRGVVVDQIRMTLPDITPEAAEEVIKQVELSAPGTKWTARLPDATAKLLALAAQTVSAGQKKPRPAGDQGNDAPAFKPGNSELSEAEAEYKKIYGKEMSEFIKKELGYA